MSPPTFEVVNPATAVCTKTWTGHSDAEVSAFIEESHRAFHRWRRTSFAERAAVLHAASRGLLERKEEYALLMTEEMGKPIAQARSEVEKCAWVCRYYAEHGESFLASETIETDARRSYVAHRPLGVVLAVMPWNFPLWQVFRFAAPALMAGNVGLLKHASSVPGCAMAIEAIFREAGLPEHVFRTLLIRSGQVEAVLDDDRVVAATLTGSGPAGSAVASASGARIKPTVLELGGTDPYLILEDADLDLAASECVTSRLINGGQSCIAAKRLIAVDAVYDAFRDKVVAEMRSRVLGDPREEGTDIGPQASVELRDELHDQVQRAIQAGATCLLGGEVPDRSGAWYPATVLADVERGTPAFVEEFFGPVAVLIRARDEAHAIDLANDSRFGLGAAVFTRDVQRGLRIAEEELEAGACFVNAFVRSDPRLPFGGVKESGYGRELARDGILAFVNRKTVYLAG